MQYPDQPSEQPVDNIRMDKIQKVIQRALEEQLPDCGTNAWFIKSAHFANMLDSIMQTIWNEA